MTRSNITAELLFDRVTGEVRKRLNKSSLNKDWTAALKSVFGDMAKDFHPDHVVSSSMHGGEILLDLAWRRSGTCADLLLAMESEWGDEGDVVNDFVKLMNVKAGLKVMIFSTEGGNAARAKMEAAIKKCLESSVHHISGEEYLLLNFTYGSPGAAYCSGYTVPQDGKQSVIDFKEKRHEKLWD